MKNLFLIILLFLFIVVLGFRVINGLDFKKLSFEIKPLNLEPNLGLPVPNDFGEKSLQKFVSPDGQFEIEYPPEQWFEIKNGEMPQNIAPSEWAENYGLRALLLAQRLAEEPAWLIVYQGNFDITIGEIFEKKQKNNQQQGWQTEIILKDIKENQGTFEIKYQDQRENLWHSKEKILLKTSGTAYLATFITPETSWQNLREKADSIINSAQTIDKF